MNTVLITGSFGLVGSTVALYFLDRGWKVFGIDNNSRAEFFGNAGSTYKNRISHKNYTHHHVDIREHWQMMRNFEGVRPNAVVHCAAQPAHEYSKKHPFEDFEINAYATVGLLEACRVHVPDAPFIFMSSSKVYGVNVSNWDHGDPVDEFVSIDQCWHSPYGASKAAADLMVQEYGHEFGMNTMCLRANCMTGAAHAGVEAHGFLNYLVKCAVSGDKYRIFGFGGEQVRDNIHSSDVAAAIWECVLDPEPAGVFNIGGGVENAISINEAIQKMHKLGYSMLVEAECEQRGADHFKYVTDNSKFMNRYPEWKVSKGLGYMIQEIIDGQSTNRKERHLEATAD